MRRVSAILFVLAVGNVAFAAPHVVFDGALQNGWGTNGGCAVATVNVGGSDITAVKIDATTQWYWAKMQNSGTVDLRTKGVLQYEIYFSSANPASTLEWTIVAPAGSEWSGPYKVSSPYTVDGAPRSAPMALSKDQWHTVQLDLSGKSYWVTAGATIKYLDWQFNYGGLAYIRDIRFLEPGGNLAPSANAGADTWIMLPINTVALDGTVSDDGRPDPPATVTALWEKVSGPGTVDFANASAVDTVATFGAAGEYVLRLTADDTELTHSDTVAITVYEQGHNEPPSVEAGPDQQIVLSAGLVNLNGTVSDDGFPVGSELLTYWEKVSGPGTVVFGDASMVDTTAAFSAVGTYVLRLNADDGAAITSDTMSVVVDPDGAVPLYGKFEADFDISTSATNLQMPYDPDAPAGVDGIGGVNVDVLFTPDDWGTICTQPAFYYEDFEHLVKGGRDWLYPTASNRWKVRFTPTQVGTWKYKIRVTDAGGTMETAEQSFPVIPSPKKGFVKVSETDTRYFEFDNGDFFPGTGVNLRFADLDWNYIAANESNFAYLQANGMQLFRTWLTHWSIFTSSWGIWESPKVALHTLYIPHTGMSVDYVRPGSDVSMKLEWSYSPGMFLGHMTQTPGVKRNTTYRIFVTYYIPTTLGGPRVVGYPYGFVVKTGGWLGDNFADPGMGTPLSAYVTNATSGWETLECSYNSGSSDYLPYLYLSLDNIDYSAGTLAYIDTVEIREDLGGGQYGPNLVPKPRMDQHYYMDQRKSYTFDKVLELAEQYGIFFKLVVLEKNDWILDHIDHNGQMVAAASNDYFYGDYRNMTKNRWLQQAWWRYCQARWGYSPNIHSWELTNEADPVNSRHFAQTDEFAIYMHQFTPNDHLASTSFWLLYDSTFNDFWSNAAYPNVDYADIHRYVSNTTDLYYDDMAKNTEYYSMKYCNWLGMSKPVVRGETGFHTDVMLDSQRIWMHNYIWGMVNPGGMYEQYWDEHDEFSSGGKDPREHFAAFRNFIGDIPLNNGNYENAAAVVSGSVDIRAWGQKDLVEGNAHLWIQNKKHTWKNIVDANPMPAVSGTVQVGGFAADTEYRVEWWDTYQATKSLQVTSVEIVSSDGSGNIVLVVNSLDTDIAVKIVNLTGDVNRDRAVNHYDIAIMAAQWLGSGGSPSADIAPPAAGDGTVNFLDYARLASRWLTDYQN